MNLFFIIAIAVLCTLMLVRNFKTLNVYKEEKQYIDVYGQALREEEGAVENLEKLLTSDAPEEYKEKGRLIKVYGMLNRNEECKSFVETLDFRNLFYDNNVFSMEKADKNSDAIIWLIMDMTKARSLSMMDITEGLFNKLQELESDYQNNVEYRLVKAVYQCLLEKEDGGTAFLGELLNGEYAELHYDKRLIGTFKKIALSFVDYMGDPIEDVEMLTAFAKTFVGQKLMGDLDIYDKYHEETEEEIEEEENE